MDAHLGGGIVSLRQQLRPIAIDLWRIAKVKPWLVLWPVTMVAWLQRNDPDVPWWLRFDTSTRDAL